MKTHLLRISVLALAAVAGVNAQSPSSMKVEVPFDFTVGTRTLLAGTYSVTRSGPGNLIIKSVDGNAGVITFATPMDTTRHRTEAKLVFHRYGDFYFLAQVWRGTGYIESVPMSRQERELTARRPVKKELAVIAER